MPSRSPRIRLAAMLLPVALLTALVTGTALAAPARTATRAVPHVLPMCTWSQLVTWLNTSGNGYAGGVGYEIQFTNVSHASCSLYGFPGVSAVNGAGHQVGLAASRSGTPATVNIGPGHAARADWLVADTGNFPASACKPVTAVGLRVYPPGFHRSQLIPFPFSVCSSLHTGSLTIQPVV